MSIPLIIENTLRSINRGLFAERQLSDLGEWIKIKYKDDRTGLVRDVFKVKKIDHVVLHRLKQDIDWEAMLKHPEPEMLARYYEKIEEQERAEQGLKRMGFITDWKSTNKRKIKRIFEDYRQTRTPEEMKVIKRSIAKHEYLNPKQIKIYQGV